MKKQYIIPVLGLCAMTLITACGDDDLSKNDFTHPGKNTVVFTCHSQLDANNSVQWEKDSQLGFFCAQTGNANTTIGVAAVSVGAKEGLFYTQQEWGEGEHEFYLYSPYNKSNTSVTSIGGTVGDVQNQAGGTNTHLTALALIYAKAKSAKVETPIEMNLKHALAYLDFDCKTTAKYVGWNVKSIQLSNESDRKMTGAYSLNMATESLALSDGYSKVQVKVNEAPTLVANENFHGYAAVVPVDLSATDCDVTIMLQNADFEYEYQLTATLKPGELKAGNFQAMELALDNMTAVKIGDQSVNLSKLETANCYIAGIAGQEYRFKATVMGNGATTPAADASIAIVPSELAPQSAQLLWQTSPGLISGVTLKSGFIRFTLNGSETTPLTQGNAVIAAYSGANGTGDILWSWHVWVTNEDLGAKVQTYKVHDNFAAFAAYQSPVMMDRNLGATAVDFWTSASGDKGAHGLFYQWGRKDPFVGPGSASLTAYATVYDKDGKSIAATDFPKLLASQSVAREDINKHPMEFYASNASWITGDNALNLWGNTTLWDSANPTGDTGSKSIYDPCPPGYRVPHPCVWSNFTPQGLGGQKSLADFPLNLTSGSAADLKTTGGLKFNYDGNGTTAVYPGIGFMNSSSGKLERVSPASNGRCDYWANAATGSSAQGVRFFTDANNCGTSMTGVRSFGFGVRCMKDETK